MISEEPAVYSVTQTARHLGISRKHVYTLIHSGQLPAHRIGKRQIRIYQNAIDNFITDNRITPTLASE